MEPKSLIYYLEQLQDPRGVQGRRHNFFEIVIIAICAVLGGANDWVHVEEFAKTQQDWFRKFLKLENGIPSHDTFGDLFSKIDPAAFSEAFSAWTRSISVESQTQIIAIDGKTAKNSGDKHKGIKALHCVSAFASSNQLVLAQSKTEAKSNEVTAIPLLLDQLVLQQAIVTIDAMGCQSKIAEQIIEKKGDYVLAVKGNQQATLDEIEHCFSEAEFIDFEGVKAVKLEETCKDHGRIEKRAYSAISSQYCSELSLKWVGIQSLLKITRQREIQDKITTETAFYISSLPYNHPDLFKAPREHWKIENSVHWVLDVLYKEDSRRVRTGHGAFNFNILCKLTLNILRQDTSRKGSLSVKRSCAGWDSRYREVLLNLKVN